MKKEHKDKINYIMNNFDFVRVYSVMSHLKWKWWFVDGERIPSVKEIKAVAKRMLVSATNGCSYSTDGFEASFKNNILSLKFNVEETYD